MEKVIYETAEEILEKARTAIDVPFKEIDKNGRLSKGKGSIGNMIEESLFNYSINSRSEADFFTAGVELKVTPFIKNGKNVRAKERLVLNIINYEKEYLKTFQNSSFWSKNSQLLLMFYEHVKELEKCNWSIKDVLLFKYPEEDLLIIKSDWEKIIEKIRTGRAHEISEGDTLYLGACTKGSTAVKSLRTQPFSNILAKQRAYSLKQNYMTYIVQNFVFGNKNDEKIIKDPLLLHKIDFESYITDKIKPYMGKKRTDLIDELGLPYKDNHLPKNINEIIISKILNLSGILSNTEEFKKANIIVKTIKVESNGSIKESMSFPIFNFCEIIKEDWETSTFRNYIESARFLFVIFKYHNNELVFEKIMFWNIPPNDLEEVKKVWNRTVNVLKNGVQFTKTSRGIRNNLPGSSENPVCHVRPHARDSSDTMSLPTGGSMPKQCFWLNNTYIKSQIENR